MGAPCRVTVAWNMPNGSGYSVFHGAGVAGRSSAATAIGSKGIDTGMFWQDTAPSKSVRMKRGSIESEKKGEEWVVPKMVE